MPMQAVLPLVSAHVFFYQEALQRYASSRSEQKCEKIEKKKKKNQPCSICGKVENSVSTFFFILFIFYRSSHVLSATDNKSANN